MKEKKSKVLIALVVILLLIIIASLGYIAFNMYQDYVAQQQHNELISQVTVETSPTDENSQNENLAKNIIDFDKLKDINEEIVAWIKIPDTNIDYPILQSMESDNYYLHRDIYGEYKYAGSIYMQYCNSTDFLDRVTVLYGHNMANGTMFADLHKFEDNDFFKNHKKFYIYTENRKLTYEIVSAYVYDDRHIMNSFNFAEDEVFLDYLNFIQNPRSTVSNSRDLKRELTVDDNVVTLSTCLNSGEGRYLLQGVLLKDEPTR